jgi:hypothetical protein
MTVTTLAAGETVIRATATRGTISKTGQATLKVTPVQPQPTIHSTPITADETWLASGNPHVVRANIEVLGANAPTLTLEPGVEIHFEPGSGLSITNGALKALGTQTAPIRMVSSHSTPVKGDWLGLVFSAAGSDSVLDQVTLSHCGKAVGENACIAMKNKAAPVLRNVTVQDSGTTGIAVADDGSAFGATNDPGTLRVLRSSSYAVRIGANKAHSLPASVYFEDNAHDDAVELRGAVSDSQTWARLGYPYVVNDLVRVESASTATLTLAAGSVLRFGSNAGLVVGENANGELRVNGEVGQPVLLTADSLNPQPGHWRGVHLHRPASSSIAHATIEYAGAGGSPQTGDGNLNVYGSSGVERGYPVINDVIVRKSSGSGFYMRNRASFKQPGSGKLTARENGGYGISMDANSAGALPQDTRIVDNTRNAVELRCCIVGSTQTWRNLGVPYVINEYVAVGSEFNETVLTLEEGVEVRFGANAAFYVGIAHPGVLKAVGSQTAPIRFVADTSSTTGGHWRGLHFWYASASQVEHVVVAQAGLTGSDVLGTGNVNVHRNIGPFLKNSTIRDSSGCGISVSDGDEPKSEQVTTDYTATVLNNTFINNPRVCIH